jgi:hypothetical protein
LSSEGIQRLYDHAVDPNNALHVLRLDPFAPLTAAAVEEAYAQVAWERHPSRYPDAEGRLAAETWAVTLAAARATLLGELSAEPVAAVVEMPRVTDVVSAPWVPVPPPATALTLPGRVSPGAVAGIIAGALAMIVVITGIGFGATALMQRLADAAPAELPEDAPPTDIPEVLAMEHYASDETGFWFETALEVYHDGRLGGCPAKFEEGCWEAALIPEASCGMLNIQYSFSNDPNEVDGEDTRSTHRTNVAAGEMVELVFGNDGYEYGWVSHVVCVAPPTAPPST